MKVNVNDVEQTQNMRCVSVSTLSNQFISLLVKRCTSGHLLSVSGH